MPVIDHIDDRILQPQKFALLSYAGTQNLGDEIQSIAAQHFLPRIDAWVDRYLAPLKNPTTPIARVTAKEPPRTGPGEFTGYGPNVPLPAVALTWLGPSAADPDAPALKVLDAILTSGKSSRLYDSLVYQQQISAQVFSNADLPQQPGMFVVGAILVALVDHGAEMIVTPCPLCQANVEIYQSEINKKQGTKFSMPVLYYSQLMTVAYGGSAKEAGLDGQLIKATRLEEIAGK